jgi:hypothetical protein
LGEGFLAVPRYAGDHHRIDKEEHTTMAPNSQSLHADTSLSRRASGALSLQDDYDRARVGSVEIAFWTDAVHGTGGIAVMDLAGTWTKHFALPAAVLSPLLAAVFRPAPDPSE